MKHQVARSFKQSTVKKSSRAVLSTVKKVDKAAKIAKKETSKPIAAKKKVKQQIMKVIGNKRLAEKKEASKT